GRERAHRGDPEDAQRRGLRAAPLLHPLRQWPQPRRHRLAAAGRGMDETGFTREIGLPYLTLEIGGPPPIGGEPDLERAGRVACDISFQGLEFFHVSRRIGEGLPGPRMSYKSRRNVVMHVRRPCAVAVSAAFGLAASLISPSVSAQSPQGGPPSFVTFPRLQLDQPESSRGHLVWTGDGFAPAPFVHAVAPGQPAPLAPRATSSAG